MMSQAAEAETVEAYREELLQQIALRLQDPEKSRVSEFAALSIERTAATELAERNAEDDASLFIDTWKRFQRRNVDEGGERRGCEFDAVHVPVSLHRWRGDQ